MKKAILFIGILYILLISSSVHGMGFGGLKGKITFEPGKSQEFVWTLIPTNDGMDYFIEITGDLAEYITLLTPDYIKNVSIKETPLVQVRLDLPLKEPSPGMHTIGIWMKELDPNSAGGLSALTGAMPRIFVNVLYPGKYLVSSMKIKDINEGGYIAPLIELHNYGEEQINKIQITHQIIDHQKNVKKTFNEKAVFLKSDEGKKIEGKQNSEGLVGGEYTLKTVVNWDNELNTHEQKFMIGNMDVDLIDYDENLTIGGIQEFNIKIKSQWKGSITDVYADIFIDDQEVKTASVNLKEWEEKTLKAFVNTDEMLEGLKDVKIIVNYGELSKEEDIKIELIELKKSFELSSTVMIVGAFSIIILILVAFNIALLSKNSHKNKDKEESSKPKKKSK